MCEEKTEYSDGFSTFVLEGNVNLVATSSAHCQVARLLGYGDTEEDAISTALLSFMTAMGKSLKALRAIHKVLDIPFDENKYQPHGYNPGGKGAYLLLDPKKGGWEYLNDRPGER